VTVLGRVGGRRRSLCGLIRRCMRRGHPVSRQDRGRPMRQLTFMHNECYARVPMRVAGVPFSTFNSNPSVPPTRLRRQRRGRVQLQLVRLDPQGWCLTKAYPPDSATIRPPQRRLRGAPKLTVRTRTAGPIRRCGKMPDAIVITVVQLSDRPATLDHAVPTRNVVLARSRYRRDALGTATSSPRERWLADAAIVRVRRASIQVRVSAV
jgi:hypothetical protein